MQTMIVFSACNSNKRLTGKHHDVSDIKYKNNIKPVLVLCFSQNWLLIAMIILIAYNSSKSFLKIWCQAQTKIVASKASIFFPKLI
jgi:hypothetical protein